MKLLIEKGASLGFTITLAALAAIILCATFVSCGRTHPSAVGAGLRPALASPGRAGLRPAPTIPLSDVLAQIDAYPAPAAVDAARFASLKAELKRLLIERANGGTAGRDAGSTKDISVEQASAPADYTGNSAVPRPDGKSLSISPAGAMNAVTDLKATVNPGGTQATLTWTEVLPGDYDNNGVVDIGDLIPLALYYGQRTDSGPDDAHRLVNGDANPEINIWDLGAIAGNFAARIDGYQVWRGHWNGSSTDWETSFLPNLSDPAQTAFTVDRPSPPPPSRRPSYWYGNIIYNDPDKNNIRYKVVAYGDGAAGAESNEAAVPATTFSVSGKVTLSGNGLAGVTLTLAPGGLHATTQADGTYVISDVANGSNTLTPTATGYVFVPVSVPVTVNGANVVGLDFTATGGLANSAWPKFRGNARNTGQSPYIGAQTNHLRWTQPVPVDQSSPAIGADGTIYIAGYDNKVYAINPADGAVRWTVATGLWNEGSPAIGRDDTVYIGSDDHQLYALNPADGSAKWIDYLGSWLEGSPAIGADGTVYMGSGDGKVYALNPIDGSQKWAHATEAAVYGSPAIGADGTIYVASTDNNLYALNPADGTSKWQRTIGLWGDVRSSPAIGSDGTVYASGDGGDVYALNSVDGAVKWKFQTSSYARMTSPSIGADSAVYVGSNEGKVYALNLSDGSVKWTYTTGAMIWSSPAVGADGTVYVGSQDNKVYALASSDGSAKWSYATEGQVNSSPAIGADGAVYIGSGDGKVYAFGGVGPTTYKVSGTVTWMGAGIQGVTLTLAPGGKTVTTQADGTYLISDVLPGGYMLTPSKAGYVFGPTTRSVSISVGDINDQNFIASVGLYSVSGTVTSSGVALPGVTMMLKPSGRTATTQADGTYSITNVLDGAYILSPALAGYWFAPMNRSFTVNGAGITNQDFAGTPGAGLADSPWPKFRGNALNTGQSPYVAAQTNAVKWTFATSFKVESSPAIGVDGAIYVANVDGHLYAVNPVDGSLKWMSSAGNFAYGSPAVASDGTIFVESLDFKVYALSHLDGSVKWTSVTDYGLYGTPAIGTDGTVYVQSYIGTLYALNPSDGSVRWTSSVGGSDSTSCPAIGADGTLYLLGGDNNIYAVNPSDGSIIWESAPISGGWSVDLCGSPAIGSDGTVYIGRLSGEVYALNPSDGSLQWQWITPFYYSIHSSPAISTDGTVYIGVDGGRVYALGSLDGSVRWSYSTGGDVVSSPAVGADGTVYVGSRDRKIYALNGLDGTVKWTYLTGDLVRSSPAIGADGTVYVGSDDGKLYAFGP